MDTFGAVGLFRSIESEYHAYCLFPRRIVGLRIEKAQIGGQVGLVVLGKCSLAGAYPEN